jgi:hypothetical protein
MTSHKSGHERKRSTTGIDRRTFPRSCVSAQPVRPCCLRGSASTAVFAAEGPVAETTAGKISGVTTNGVHGFKGVPYGAPTSGRNRFMPPQKPQPWTGVRSATEWAGRAPQLPPGWRQRPELSGIVGAPDRLAESEECLTLNIWYARPE